MHGTPVGFDHGCEGGHSWCPFSSAFSTWLPLWPPRFVQGALSGEAADPPRRANNPHYTSTDPHHTVTITYLEELESVERQRCRPRMGPERSIYPTECHGTLDHALALPCTAEEAAAAEAAAADSAQRSLRDLQWRRVSFVDVAAARLPAMLLNRTIGVQNDNIYIHIQKYIYTHTHTDIRIRIAITSGMRSKLQAFPFL